MSKIDKMVSKLIPEKKNSKRNLLSYLHFFASKALKINNYTYFCNARGCL
jgi:hypothetical protein